MVSAVASTHFDAESSGTQASRDPRAADCGTSTASGRGSTADGAAGSPRRVDHAAAGSAAKSTTTRSGRSATSTSSRASTASSRSEPPERGSSCASSERRHVADLFLQAADNRLQVAVHCGAQTTRDTVALAEHAAEVGADAVVVIGPPYFKLDEHAQYAHFFAAAAACAPLPFYVYEFAATTGYPIAPTVLERLRDSADNVVGLKVSDTPFDAFEKYLLPGFDIFVGPEALIADGMARGALGAVSALASALPREVGAVVRDPSAGRRGTSGRAPLVRRAVPAPGRAQAAPRAPGRSRPGGRARTAPHAHRRTSATSSTPGRRASSTTRCRTPRRRRALARRDPAPTRSTRGGPRRRR